MVVHVVVSLLNAHPIESIVLRVEPSRVELLRLHWIIFV